MTSFTPRVVNNLDTSSARNDIEAPSLVRRIDALKNDAVDKLAQTGIGKTISAELIAKLDNGSYIAKIANTAIRLELSGTHQIGEKLRLNINQIQPRPSFIFEGKEINTDASNHAASEALSASKLSQLSKDTLVQADFLKSTQLTPDILSQLSHKANPLLQTEKNHPSSLSQSAIIDIHSTSEELDHLNNLSTKLGNANKAMTEELAASLSPKTKESLLAYQLQTLAGERIFKAYAQSISSTNQAASATEEGNIANPDASSAQMSSGAKFLGQILNSTYDSNNQAYQKNAFINESKIALLRENHVLANHHLNAYLEGQLRDTLTQSGLFYESHVAKWSQGQYQIQQLAHEPQSQFSNSSDIFQTQHPQHPQAAQLIQQQLHAFENQQVHWSGFLTPQIPIQWSFQKLIEDKKQEAHTHPKPIENESWSSSLQVDLPHLGQVSIQFQLQGQHVQIGCRSVENHTAQTLQEAHIELQRALADIHLDLLSFASHLTSRLENT